MYTYMPPAVPVVHFPFTARNGSRFTFAKKIAPPIPNADVEKINKEFKRKLNVRVRNAKYTNEYNCHGLTFAAKLGWFDDVRRMLNCHDYVKIAEIANFDIDTFDPAINISRGDVIVYYDGDVDNVTHTGIAWNKRTRKASLDITVLSKWGGLSEYFHRHDKVPIGYGKSVEIWTDRRV